MVKRTNRLDTFPTILEVFVANETIITNIDGKHEIKIPNASNYVRENIDIQVSSNNISL